MFQKHTTCLLKLFRLVSTKHKPGPAQVGATSKAQKWQKHFKMSNLVNWGPFYEIFLEKSLAMPKKTERGNLWSRPVLYLRGKPFWFSSLGQRVQMTRWRLIKIL